MTDGRSTEPIRVVFVGTSNATRSILAEAILRLVGGDRLAAARHGRLAWV
jgi:protein-tyrosine-phosphatase